MYSLIKGFWSLSGFQALPEGPPENTVELEGADTIEGSIMGFGVLYRSLNI